MSRDKIVGLLAKVKINTDYRFLNTTYISVNFIFFVRDESDTSDTYDTSSLTLLQSLYFPCSYCMKVTFIVFSVKEVLRLYKTG